MKDSYGLAAGHAIGHNTPGRRAEEIDENDAGRDAGNPHPPETTPGGWAWPADTPEPTVRRAQRC